MIIYFNNLVCHAIDPFEPRAKMLPGFEKIVEERIQRALKKGELDNLPGRGEPLPPDETARIPEELRLAYRVLKNADFVPPEIEIKKEIRQTEDLLAGMTDTRQKYRTLKKLNFLIMKLNSLRNTSVEFEMPQRYEAKLIQLVASKNSGQRPSGT